MADTNAVNPWTWQEALSFSHAVETRGASRLLHCAGQAAVDGEGTVQFPGDMAAQLNRAFDNLETVLSQAGMSLADVVRLNYYVTDMSAFIGASAVITARLQTLRVKPSGTLLGVAALFHPDAMVEIEATAVG